VSEAMLGRGGRAFRRRRHFGSKRREEKTEREGSLAVFEARFLRRGAKSAAVFFHRAVFFRAKHEGPKKTGRCLAVVKGVSLAFWDAARRRAKMTGKGEEDSPV